MSQNTLEQALGPLSHSAENGQLRSLRMQVWNGRSIDTAGKPICKLRLKSSHSGALNVTQFLPRE